jgi:hypothetical protein
MEHSLVPPIANFGYAEGRGISIRIPKETLPWAVSASPSAHFPKFVLHSSIHFQELRKVKGTSKPKILVPLFYLTFLDRIRRLWCRNVK